MSSDNEKLQSEQINPDEESRTPTTSSWLWLVDSVDLTVQTNPTATQQALDKAIAILASQLIDHHGEQQKHSAQNSTISEED